MHPFDQSGSTDPSALHLVFDVLARGLAWWTGSQRAKLDEWWAEAAALELDESKLHQNLADGPKTVLKGQEAPSAPAHPGRSGLGWDSSLVSELAAGMPLVGPIPSTPTFVSQHQAPSTTCEELWRGAREWRQQVFHVMNPLCFARCPPRPLSPLGSESVRRH